MQPQYWPVEGLPVPTPAEHKLFKDLSIEDTKELLKRANTLEKKQTLANKLQIEQKRLYKWVALADLARIPSVNYQYCGLLLHAGVVSLKQLSQTPFHRLHPQIVRLQVATLGRKDLSPPIEQVKQWVDEAKILQNSRG